MNDTTNVDDQESRGRAVATSREWDVAAVYKDNSRSAWQRNRKRPGWEQMLADIEAGTIGAIIVYHGDRLIRQPYDLELLLTLARDKGVLLASPTGQRDLSNPDDQFILRIEAAQACRESDNTSRRVKRHLERKWAQGETRTGGPGGRAFGFATNGIDHVPAEANALREAAERILSGEPMAAICRHLTAKGITGTTGQPLNYQRLGVIISRPRIAGLMPDGRSEAKWEPILDRQTWEEVCALLRARSASHGRTSQGRRFLLSGIAECASCGQTMTAWFVKGPSHVYKCVNPDCPRRLSRAAAYLDAYVKYRMLELLNDPAVLAARSRPRDPAVVRQIEILEARRQAARKQFANAADYPDLDQGLIAQSIGSYTRRIEELREKMTTGAEGRLIARQAGTTEQEWDGMPLELRRALILAAYRIVVKPVSRRGAGFNPDDVKMKLRED